MNLIELRDPCEAPESNMALRDMLKHMYDIGHGDGWADGYEQGCRAGMSIGDAADRSQSWWDGFATAAVCAAAMMILGLGAWWVTT